MNADLSVTERAITIMLYIMRSQMFFDGNKRTAQLAANQIMIQGGADVYKRHGILVTESGERYEIV